MSIQIWWKERLAARHPFSGEALAGVDYKVVRNKAIDSWPTSVARQSLFKDYKVWHSDRYLAPYKAVGYYLDNPDRMPVVADDLEFFSAMGPLLYIAGKKNQTRNYLVNDRIRHEGKWAVVKRRRYFVKLCAWEAHCATFELLTGLKVHEKVVYFSAEKNKIINDAIDTVEDGIEKNRDAMVRSMGRD